MNCWCGIDVGDAGALAVYTDTGALDVWDMPLLTTKVKKEVHIDEDRLYDLIDNMPPNCQFYIEKQQAMPKQGVTSMFNLGTSYGIIRGILRVVTTDRGYVYHKVSARVWKRKLGLDKYKGNSAFACLDLFPDYETLWLGPRGGIKDGRCEAALIAYYGGLISEST